MTNAGLKAGMAIFATAAFVLLFCCSVVRLHMMASMRSWSPNTELSEVPFWARGVGFVGRNSKGSRKEAAVASCLMEEDVTSCLKSFTTSLLLPMLGSGAVLGASPGQEDMEAVDDDDVERLYTGGNMAESTGESGEQMRGSNILWGAGS